jgi:glutathione peroxidase
LDDSRGTLPVRKLERREQAAGWQGIRVSIYSTPVETLAGVPTTLGEFAGKPLFIVNVASRCGLTPQYEKLQMLHERYAGRGLRVLGFPCNQFMEQEPGTAEEIAEFCSTVYNITFPLYAKIEVNGPNRHLLYDQLVGAPDAAGVAGDVQWNFEKFLVTPDGRVANRFRPRVEPLADEVIAAVEAALGALPPPPPPLDDEEAGAEVPVPQADDGDDAAAPVAEPPAAWAAPYAEEEAPPPAPAPVAEPEVQEWWPPAVAAAAPAESEADEA